VSDFAYERLTQFDNSFLVFENPCAHMHVGATQIFEAGPLGTADGGIDVERIRRYVESRLHLIPRYRQRLLRTPLEDHPVWVDDDRFNLFYHVRHTRLPPPGDERMLKRVAGRVMSQQLDFHKPLWELWVIEGLERNRFALVHKSHHCMIDGISGADVISTLLKAEPDTTIESVPHWAPRPSPTTAQLLRGEIGHRLRAPFDLGRSLWRLARDEDHERHRFVERMRATARMLGSTVRTASNTPFNQPIGPYWRFDWLPMPLDAIRAVKRELGGTVNDVVLAIVAGAVRRFLKEGRHTDVKNLDFRVMAPVSTRTENERGTLGNRVSAWIVPLPLAERDPRARLRRLQEITTELKESKQALAAETLTGVTEWTGSTLLSLGARLATWGRPFNMVVTNVPGPQLPLYLLGAPMVEAYPMVPLFGNLSTGIALFSYAGTLYWGLMADWDRIPDLHDFTLAIDASFRDLQQAANAAPPAIETKPERPAAPRPPRTLHAASRRKMKRSARSLASRRRPRARTRRG
jgi:WS/DGAT/MGAT family acyltransferase